MAQTRNDYPKIIAKAWSDPDYHKRLMEEPGKVLKEEGWDIPSSCAVQAKPDSSQVTLVVGVPKKPEGLSDERLRDEANKHCFNPCGF